ncbi:MAG: OmpH family outer membrane protein [Nitrospirae bacterium]|jgi:outer membrane protein|nr:OmpH family outer membrane protein [Nitrospirota bacterium]
MKRFTFKKISTLCSLIFALCLFPVISYAAEQTKIGLIDVQKILNESDAGKKAKTDLESIIRSKQSIIDEKGRTIEKLKSELEKQASVLSAEAKKTKEDELEKFIKEYQRLVQDSQAEVKKKEAELTDAILKEVHEIVNKMGEEEGYSIIFEHGMVLYSDKEMDITDAVLKKYNESKVETKK